MKGWIITQATSCLGIGSNAASHTVGQYDSTQPQPYAMLLEGSADSQFVGTLRNGKSPATFFLSDSEKIHPTAFDAVASFESYLEERAHHRWVKIRELEEETANEVAVLVQLKRDCGYTG